MDIQIFLSIQKYCKIKDITTMTFYRQKKQNKIPHKIIKKGNVNNYKKYYLVINSKDIITIKSDKNGIIM